MTHMAVDRSRYLANVFYGAVAGASLLLAAWYALHYAINADNAAMLGYARRMLAGGRLGVDFIDMNPPLSIIAYLPAAAVSRLGLPGWDAFNLYIVLAIAGSAWLIWRLVAALDILARGETALLLFTFVLGNFLIPNTQFGERDQLVLLGLLPLMLAQFALAERKALPRWLCLVSLVAGAFALCLKPHYAVAPAAMIVWRLLRQKKPAAVWRLDVLVLGAGALLYAALLAIIFPVYLHDVMPDVIAFYAGHIAIRPFPHWPEAFMAAGALGAALFCFNGAQRRFYMTLTLGAAMTYLAYLAQAKGYAYHLVPCRILLAVSSAGMAGTLLRQPALAAAGIGLVLLGLFPVHPAYPTHRTYPGLPLAQIVRAECGDKPCPFVVDNEFQFMTDETALYTGGFSASRFPAFWFESPLACGQRPGLFPKYAGMIAEDMARWRPVFVALLQSPDHCPGEAGRTTAFDFGAFYSRDPAFAAQWAHYKFERTASFNRRDYYRGTDADYDHTLTFAIYRRTTP